MPINPNPTMEGMSKLRKSEMMKFIKSLNAEEASLVLKCILEDSPELVNRIYDIAINIVSGVDAAKIMNAEVMGIVEEITY